MQNNQQELTIGCFGMITMENDLVYSFMILICFSAEILSNWANQSHSWFKE